MPPLYLRVFERLLIEANHTDTIIPYKESGSKTATQKLIKRGERLTSIRQICRWVGWYERGIFKEPNPRTIVRIIDYLEQNLMLTIYRNKGNRTETHYSVCNYSLFQASDDNESNGKVTPAQQSVHTNKKDKEGKEDITARFEAFYAAYPKHRGRDDAEKAFHKLKPNEALISVMMLKLEEFKQSPEWLKDSGKFIPYPATWLNKKRWEDELTADKKPSGNLAGVKW